MRMPNDEQLLRSDADIDIILGGHDHHYELKEVCLHIFFSDFSISTENLIQAVSMRRNVIH